MVQQDGIIIECANRRKDEVLKEVLFLSELLGVSVFLLKNMELPENKIWEFFNRACTANSIYVECTKELNTYKVSVVRKK